MAETLEAINHLQAERRSMLCVGLDIDPARMPEGVSQTKAGLLHFSEKILEAAAPYATAWKINVAFLEALGSMGWQVLEDVIAKARAYAPEALLIADAKRGDIGASSQRYAQAFFGHLGVDALTVSPYMGVDSIAPFLQWPDKWVFVLAATSNPGAAAFQLPTFADEQPLYLRVIQQFEKAERQGQLGYVAGATRPDLLETVRKAAPTAPLLIPGVGAQGGDLEATLQAAHRVGVPVFINATRSIIYASGGPDFAEAAAAEAQRLQQQMAAFLAA